MPRVLSFSRLFAGLVNECVWRERQQIPLRGKTFGRVALPGGAAGQLGEQGVTSNAVWRRLCE